MSPNAVGARQIASLKRLTQARARLLDSISGLNTAALCAEPVGDGWTVKDILGHIVSWNEELRAEIALILDGQHPGYKRRISGSNDFSQWNQRWVDHKRRWPWRRMRADFERDCRAASALIKSLKPSDFRRRGVTPWKRAATTRPSEPTKADTDSVETLLSYHWRHMNQHARQIENWRKKRAG